MYGEGRIVGVIEIFKRGFSFIGYVMTGAFLFLKDTAFIKFTRCGLIAKICHRGNSRQKEMCYDSSIRHYQRKLKRISGKKSYSEINSNLITDVVYGR